MERVKPDLAAERTGLPGDSTAGLRSNQGSRKSSDLRVSAPRWVGCHLLESEGKAAVARLGAGRGVLGSL